jgi:hypothetical protein
MVLSYVSEELSFWSGGVPCAHIKFRDDQMKCTLSLLHEQQPDGVTVRTSRSRRPFVGNLVVDQHELVKRACSASLEGVVAT